MRTQLGTDEHELGEISWATAAPMLLVSAFDPHTLSVPPAKKRNARFLLPQKTGAADAGGK